ncbi:hypothetical protein A2686_02480 [Candidatus Woesebacteria bacterium RIFCSPHIGHO2_01_FULL_38_10]|uniref:Uncharacterized protein n=1 Tax=Candidatus Woesebacteria bacterium RIFCSPLOWO2_01_FULL_39_10b TaxID=1802517 RepID=A0A1F8B8Q8_9BACT|nr:MAG: hypothetical protein A2686_02480 [Candidatus Woesebacteria bacterium RIFCSPHIGHO2_01_FULL_38_10]OGM60434.1 MAG: hypothetical protein A2892_00170 [Candidatus Woesebacteria bacterium RIFCSPLOWO2_01_FULL_39_10b]
MPFSIIRRGRGQEGSTTGKVEPMVEMEGAVSASAPLTGHPDASYVVRRTRELMRDMRFGVVRVGILTEEGFVEGDVVDEDVL